MHDNFIADILGNQGSLVDLTFRAPLGVDASPISCKWRHNGNVILIDGSRITNIAGDDEGDYACHYYYNQLPYSDTVAHINVIGNNVRGMQLCPFVVYMQPTDYIYYANRCGHINLLSHMRI